MPDWLVPLLGIVSSTALGVLVWQATRRGGDRDRIKVLEERNDVLEARNARKEDYIHTLRKDITKEGKQPPPFPEGLFD
jgi:cell division protein FtsB